MIGADDLAQVLGIEARRERGRADEIAKHHAEEAPLGRRLETRRCGARGLGGTALLRPQRRDRGQDLAPMPEPLDPQFLEVFRGQFEKNLGVDRICCECLLILREPQVAKPGRYVAASHARLPRRVPPPRLSSSLP